MMHGVSSPGRRRPGAGNRGAPVAGDAACGSASSTSPPPSPAAPAAGRRAHAAGCTRPVPPCFCRGGTGSARLSTLARCQWPRRVVGAMVASSDTDDDDNDGRQRWRTREVRGWCSWNHPGRRWVCRGAPAAAGTWAWQPPFRAAACTAALLAATAATPGVGAPSAVCGALLTRVPVLLTEAPRWGCPPLPAGGGSGQPASDAAAGLGAAVQVRRVVQRGRPVWSGSRVGVESQCGSNPGSEAGACVSPRRQGALTHTAPDC